jgi:Protein of unknown function (DUF5131)
MADTTDIAWANSTFNPWIGCQKVSPACAFCYAEAEWDLRYHRVQWGPGGERSLTKTWDNPRRWQKQAARFTGKSPGGWKRRLYLCRLEETVNNRGVGPLAIAQMVVSIWRHPSLQRVRYHDRVVSDLHLSAAIG